MYRRTDVLVAAARALAACGTETVEIPDLSVQVMEVVPAGPFWLAVGDTDPHTPGNMPMCVDQAGMTWVMSLSMSQEPPAGPVSVAFMMQGSTFPSVDDPDLMEPPGGEGWIETGPILMLMNVRGLLTGLPTGDVDLDSPFVMYGGTRYEHLMIPIRPPR
jgi:hypothetical protein